jgi:hypothetical protein
MVRKKEFLIPRYSNTAFPVVMRKREMVNDVKKRA